MKKRPHAPWDFSDPYRQAAEPSAPVVPGQPPPARPDEHEWLRVHNGQTAVYLPVWKTPLVTVDDIIVEVHNVYERTGNRKIHAVLVHPRDYVELVNHMSKREYHRMPEYSGAEMFTEGQIAPPTVTYPRMHKMQINTGIGPVDVREDLKVKEGTVLVVE